MINNKEIADNLKEIGDLLDIKGSENFRKIAYYKASDIILNLSFDISKKYQEKGVTGITEIKGIGKSIAEKIEEYIKKKEIKYLKDLKEETAIRQVVTHYFKTKKISLEQLKRSSKKKEIVYSRYTKPAKQLIELAGDVEKAKKSIDIVASWANSRNLDYSIETVFKKWPEINRLKPKKKVKKPFYKNNPMVWSDYKKKWYVIDETNTWLEFADNEDQIEWRSENN